ncbi:hypothetical protein J31TS6_56990 [Brevibacillus reuszeri]|uniref:phage tail assembly protein n=1 Tax=Brevibacillus reuszeri TaxID=54915 RepID=UPI001B1E5041|nr:phage tail assembly protein [Brevibacillus reuszeri]GIO09671.1 hypothetical protein J31TS6_56990 [Brevibacillus reuszeri]
MKIKISSPIEKNGEMINELNLDLTKLTGRDMIDTEFEARALGDDTIQPLYGQRALAIIAAKASGLLVDDILSLPAPDYLVVTNSVNNFLFSWGLVAGMQASE